MHRNFVIGLISLTLGFFSIQGLLSLLIVQIQLILGYSSNLAGLAFLPLVLLGAPAIAVMHMLCKYIDARWLDLPEQSGVCLDLLLARACMTIRIPTKSCSGPWLVEGMFLGSFFTPVTVLTLARPVRSADHARQRRSRICCGSRRARSGSRSKESSCSDASTSINCTWPTILEDGSRSPSIRWGNWRPNWRRRDCRRLRFRPSSDF